MNEDPSPRPLDALDRHVIDALPLAVVVSDLEGTIVRFNARASALWGDSLEAGRPTSAGAPLLRPDGSDVREEDRPSFRAMRTGLPVQDTASVVGADGAPTALTITALPLHDASGQVIGAFSMFQNIGSEAPQDTDRATLAAIVDSSDDAIVSKTLDGVITSWNAGAERIFGFTAREAVGQHISLIIPPDRLSEESDVLARLRRGEKIDHFQTIRRTKDGHLIDISLTVSPVRSLDGRIVGASKVARDITDTNRANRALGLSQRRYRRLFDSAGVSLWEEDLSAVKAAISAVMASGVRDIRQYVNEHPEFVERCLRLVRIIDVNRTTLRMFGARSTRDLSNELTRIFDDSTRTVFAEQLVAIGEGRTIFESEVTLKTLAGGRIDAVLSVRFPESGNPRDPDAAFDSVLVSLTDITPRRLAEEALRDSEALFREMADSAPAIIWLTDASGRFTFLSRRWQEFTGVGVPEALQHGWWTVIHPADVDAVRGLFEDSNARHAAFMIECRVRRTGGDYRWVMMPGEPRFDSSGNFVGFIGSVIDITERRVAEDTVRGEVQIRETLADVAASLASELDPEKLVQAVTDAATHLTGAEFGAFSYGVVSEAGESTQLCAVSGIDRGSLGDLSSPRAASLFAPTLGGERIVRIDDVTAAAESGQADGAAAKPPGELRMRSYLGVPVISRSREVLGGLVLGHSRPGVFMVRHERLAAGIATWAALALDNARLYKAAQDANTTKDEFLATLSHELRTPLNSMLGWTHLLRSGSLDGDMRQRALEALERNGRAQAQLIDDLLDVSRIVSGRLELKGDDVDLAAIIGSAVDTVRPAATAKQLNVALVVPPAQVIVAGDADRLRQVFWNLLSNAVKFTPARGRIDVEVRVGGQEVEVAIRDTGAGISREFLGHVFERFRQADSSHARRHGGLGLGLAIVRHLVESHGGTVGVSSDGEGLGATFTVRLPVRTVRRSILEPASQDTGRVLLFGGLRILVVDDERDAREFLGTLLTMHGADVLLAGSAGEALGILASRRVDLLLADLGLPDRDGYALIRAIRSLAPELGGLVPAVAVTAYAGLRERTRALEAGYGWHVAKPVEPDQLLTVVTAAVRSIRGPSSDVING